MIPTVFLLLLIATAVVGINKNFAENDCEDSGNVCIPPQWCRQGYGPFLCPSHSTLRTVCCNPEDIIYSKPRARINRSRRQDVWAIPDANREKCEAAGGKCQLKRDCDPSHVIRRLKCGEKHFCCKQNISRCNK